MTKISKRLLAIASFIEKKDSVADIGCDHGLLSIYLKENNLIKTIIASDINQNALNNAIKNIETKNLKIKTILSDGIKDINTDNLNTLIISGMGTSTILHILTIPEKLKNINKIIIQSNNNHQELRQGLNDIGYYLEEENYTYDKNKWYITCKFIKSEKQNSKEIIKYGYLNNQDYNKYLLNHLKTISKKIPLSKLHEKIEYYKAIKHLKKAISNI